MATNTYFTQGFKPEQDLYEDIIIESIQMYGQDCYYIPREIVAIDNILNEDIESKFSSAYTIEMYLEDVEGFSGDGTLFQKFGLEIRDQVTLIVAKRRWQRIIEFDNNEINTDRPREGDLIYLPLSKGLFEIKFVEHEQPFYQLNNLPIYKLQCELFEYGGEAFDTGVDHIDDFETRLGESVELKLDSSNIEFNIREKVYQDIGSDIIWGEVVSDENDKLYLTQVKSENGTTSKFKVTDIGNNIGNIQNEDSPSISYTILEVNDRFDQISQNEDFETNVDTIIDFSEDNPFSEDM